MGGLPCSAVLTFSLEKESDLFHKVDQPVLAPVEKSKKLDCTHCTVADRTYQESVVFIISCRKNFHETKFSLVTPKYLHAFRVWANYVY